MEGEGDAQKLKYLLRMNNMNFTVSIYRLFV